MASNSKSLSKSNPNTTTDNKRLNLKYSTKLNSSSIMLVCNSSKLSFSRQQCHSYLAQFNSKLDNTSFNNKSKAALIISPILLVCYLQQRLPTTLLRSCDPLTSTEQQELKNHNYLTKLFLLFIYYFITIFDHLFLPTVFYTHKKICIFDLFNCFK